MGQSNECKCCDAILRVLEHRLSAQRADLHFPDRNNRAEKRVDVCVRIGENRYVLEHTVIEPFEDTMGIGANFCNFVRPINERFSEVLPGPALYTLELRMDHRVTKKKLVTKAQQALICWVSAEARSLYEMARASEYLTKSETTAREFPGLIPYSVCLSCTLTGEPSDNEKGKFSVVRWDESDEKQRFQRLCRAFADKCPKLQQCKERGARTILVLEQPDIALSNHIDIRGTLDRAAEKRADLPDEIYLVWAVPDVTTWYVFPMNPAADSLFLPDPGVERKAFQSTDLEDLMREESPASQCKFCGISP